MTSTQRKDLAVLAMVRSLPDHFQAERRIPGRLTGLYNKLIKEADRLLGHCPLAGAADMLELEVRLNAWTMKTGWHRKGKHPISVVVFLIGIVSDNMPKQDKLIEILQLLFDYFDRAKKAPQACLPAGTLSAERFNEVFE